jgi:osmotically-inducible protein OsmY
MNEQQIALPLEASAEGLSKSDMDLERRIDKYLHRRLPFVASVKIHVRNGTAALQGVVESWSVKSRCLDCCRHVASVFNVVDKMQVVPSCLGQGPAGVISRKPR